jgi:hypothetical protein
MRTPIVLTKHGFHIGDRVKFVDEVDPDDGVVFDQEGTVCTFEGCDDENIGVRWDKNSENYHSCSNFCEHRHGWYVPYHSLVNISESIDLGEINTEVPAVDMLFGTI